MVDVVGPDGAKISFPDDTPKETMKAALAKHYGPPKTAAPPQAAAPAAQPEATLKPYEPTMRENIAAKTQEQMEWLGMKRNTARDFGKGWSENVAGNVPILQQAMGAQEAKRHIEQGQYGQAGMDVLGAAPIGIGKAGHMGQGLRGARPANLAGEAAAHVPGPFDPKQGWRKGYISTEVGGNAREAAAANAGQGPVTKQIKDTFAGYGDPGAVRSQHLANETQGVAARGNAQQAAAVSGYEKAMANLHPFDSIADPATLSHYQGALAANPEAAARVSPAQLAVMDYIENRSANPKWPLKDPELKHMADELRAQAKQAAKDVQELPDKHVPHMVEDYAPHYWEGPPRTATGGARQPSKGFTKGRTYDTYKEGIDAGLVPRGGDPIQIFATGLANQRNYLAKNVYFQAGREAGDVRFARAGSIPPGFAELTGAPKPGGGRYVAVAPESWAQAWNALYSPGIAGNAAFDAVQGVNNAMKQAELGFSGYHAFTMGHELIASELGRAMGETVAGKPLTGLKSAGSALIAPLREMTPKSIGKRYIEEWRKPGSIKDPTMQKIVDLMTRTNFRPQPTHLDLLRSEIGGTQGQRLTDMVRKGTLGKEIGKGVQNIKDLPRVWASKPLKEAIQTSVKTAIGSTITPAQKITEAVMSPLFETYIPRIKTAAFANKLESFMKLNPTATDQELLGAANRIASSVENRMGEMVRDRLFWKNTANDLGQMLFLSPTWQIGAFKEIAGSAPQLVHMLGGAEELASGAKLKGMNTKLEYMAGFLASTYAAGATYEHFMTEGGQKPPGAGEGPRDPAPIQQMHPRTGGVTPQGKPEEMVMPGYGKEILEGYHIIKRLLAGHPRQALDEAQGWVGNKASPAARVGKELLSGKDWRGDPTTPQETAVNAVTPFTLGNVQNRMEGTNIPWFMSVIGFRPAGMKTSDPEGYQNMLDTMDTKAEAKKQAHKALEEQRRERKYQGPNP